MTIETHEIISIPDYTESERYKTLKKRTYDQAKRSEPFEGSDLPPAEYKYYSQMHQIFVALLAGKIDKETATKRNDEIYKAFKNDQDAQNCYMDYIMDWNKRIKDSEELRVQIAKAKTMQEMLMYFAGIAELLTKDRTLVTSASRMVDESV